MPTRVRDPGLRQTKSRVPEVPKQKARAAAIRVRRVFEERGDFPIVYLCGGLWVMRRRSRAGSVLAEEPRLSRLFGRKRVRVEPKVGMWVTSTAK